MVKQGRRMGKLTKVLLSVFGTIIILAIAALIIVNIYIGKSKPFIDGVVSAAFLDEDVTIVRDEFGVPHITAESDADLYRTQGYVQAQDRLFQMDMARRQASGRLSEVVGEVAVETDKKFRTFSLRAAAEASYDGYDEEGKKVLGWYAEGVNAFIAYVHPKNVPMINFIHRTGKVIESKLSIEDNQYTFYLKL